MNSTKSKKNLVKLTLLLASSMTIMAATPIAPSLPQMEEVFSDFPFAAFLTKLVLTMPAIFIALLSPLAGYIIDKTGRKKMLLISLFIYALGGTSGLYFSNIYWILAGRALLGVSVAGTMTTTIALIADYYEGEERRSFMGYQGSFMALGGVVFITLGGLFADISWRLPFVIYFLSLFVLALAILNITEPKLKVRTERVSGIDKKEKVSRWIILIYLSAFLGFVFFYVIPLEIPFLLKEKIGANNTVIGISLGISILVGAIVSFNYSWIKARLSFPAIYAITFLMIAIGYGFIYIAASYSVFLTGLIIQGAGTGLLMPNSNLWLVNLAPEHLRGRLVGNLSTAVYLGQFLSPLFLEPVSQVAGIQGAFGIFGIIIALIGIGFIFVSRMQVLKSHQ